MRQLAYSTLTLKAVDEDQRVIEGIASTPVTDRQGDVVEPLGAVFTLPMPFLWQHNSREPIGEVFEAKATKDGIKIKARILKITEPGALKDRLDEAWLSIKHKLVRGLSIGMDPIEHSRIDGTYGLRFIKWAWLELSAVTIPANAEALIALAKSLDAVKPAAPGTGRSRLVTPTSPGGTGSRETTAMKNTSEQITELKSTLKLKTARMEELSTKEADDGLTDDERGEYSVIAKEADALTGRIGRLEAIERAQITLARPVGTSLSIDTPADRGPRFEIKSNLPAGIEFARYVICKMAAHLSGGAMTAMEVAKARYPDNPRIQYTLKAAIAPGLTTDATWGGPLVSPENLAGEFIEFLRPQTIIGKFGTNGIPSLRRVPFNVRVVGQTSGSTAYWVGQNAQKPLTKMDFEATTLTWAKIATIATMSDELARFSSPAAEQVVRDDLARAIVELMDNDFIDPSKAVSANVSPASITNGVSPGTTSGVTADDVRTDLKALLAGWLTTNQDPSSGVLVMPTTLALSLSLMVNALGQPEFPAMSMKGGALQGIPVIASQNAQFGSPSNAIVVLVNASEVFLSDDGGVSIDASREASLEMSDNPGGESGTVVSMFQNNLIALRAERYINWKKRRSTAVAFLDNVAWGDAA